MILNNLEVNDSHPKIFGMSAEVIIKRDDKYYVVHIKMQHEYRKLYKNSPEELLAVKNLVMSFYENCERIDKHHIPIKEGEREDFRGRDMANKEFVW